ncbi:peptide-methionine (S)-S-oxide reductase MsrA [Actinobacillus equuli]|uniref:peptide-methionine (S)-S-oxide reductase MsrA n=1 Tax=Actinobacillus equuli TaxID=718 RepID=UPI0024424D8F|nr:peptide-methionine (S)-S-oxide reductase MsrA [Actinobacillus equuli]WGE75633.1 peptide-methionine (S)-S-oxide reductase MsrA [Actinobacillus equuli subsp. haemolyticus]WGE77529.1 peptide-methionine (S)-S-oxide reductase MsrA [Actinobacillus equuli subsp. haemolyticus]WGE81621.1 peptide-methionine (S)-S-oxide reductase MsrA [Actinobacillus equuli subsp. haemolyticus]
MANIREIYLAGGCFWGTEAFMQRINGVIDAQSGYANGNTENPTYQEVCAGSGHAEVVKVTYDADKISLAKLLDYYFKVIDPVSVNQQGEDKGIQYRTGIYYVDAQDIPVINQALADLQAQYAEPLAVENTKLEHYFPAEEYHQDYLDKNPNGYCHIDLQLMNEILRNQ